ncbi:AAA family ATPase [Streptomyces sp. NPDC002669]|uniref:AAA family ATPase n=1 Tax=Streptomyces sp. NPDC002669 TaxID=3364658 RepID=UPI0036BBC930
MTDTAPPATPFITRVRIENYKSIAHCDVQLGPFTVLLGLNAAGKSNFLDALRFVRDAVSRGLPEAVGERGGLVDVLRRVPEAAEACTIALEFHVPEHSTETVLTGRYEITFGYAPDSEESYVEAWVQRECCEIGPADSPLARFQVENRDVFQMENGDIEKPTAGRTGRVRPGELYLPLVSASGETYGRLRDALSGMFFYEPELCALRDARPAVRSGVLAEDGGHLGGVLGLLDPVVRERVSAYSGAIVPQLTQVSPSTEDGDYIAAKMTLSVGPRARPMEFRAESMSEGTIRAIGLLAALFQPAARDGRLPLVAVEEPELALHPSAAGALFDALTEASLHTQILATSQSSELFDRKEADLDAIRVVVVQDGVTAVGPVDDVSRRIVRDGLATVGDLLRSDQMVPQPPRTEN